jgi:hypothetical protein
VCLCLPPTHTLTHTPSRPPVLHPTRPQPHLYSPLSCRSQWRVTLTAGPALDRHGLLTPLDTIKTSHVSVSWLHPAPADRNVCDEKLATYSCSARVLAFYIYSIYLENFADRGLKNSFFSKMGTPEFLRKYFVLHKKTTLNKWTIWIFGKCADLGLWIQIFNQQCVNTNYSEGLRVRGSHYFFST